MTVATKSVPYQDDDVRLTGFLAWDESARSRAAACS